MIWTVKRGPVKCGATPLGHMIPAGQPVAMHERINRLIRCEEHAGAPVDWKAIDAAMLALEREELEAIGRQRETNLTRVSERPRLARQLTALTDVIAHADLPDAVRRRDRAIAGRDE